jgi:hypothetical protein
MCVAAAALGALGLALQREAHANDDAAVPPALQADLLARVAAYDKNLAARAGARVRILVCAHAGDLVSERVAVQLARGMSEVPLIAGLGHEEEVVPVERGADVPALVRTRRPAIVYLAPGFSDEETRTAAVGLSGQDVLSAGAVARYVPDGIVLGFDVVAGRPKLLLNVRQAKKQNVSVRAELLRLVKVVE